MSVSDPPTVLATPLDSSHSGAVTLDWSVSLAAESLQRGLAGARAISTRGRANLAMLVLAAVPSAFLLAHPAGKRARLDHGSDDLLVRSRPPRRDRARGRADIRAVEVQPDTLGQLPNRWFREAGIRARHARLCAVVAALDTREECVVRVAFDVGMGRDHLFDMHVTASSMKECRSSKWRAIAAHGEGDGRGIVLSSFVSCF